MIERKPKKAPLPCFALEYDPKADQCQTCPHESACIEHMPSRANKVPLDRVRFNVLPAELQKNFLDNAALNDPELPYLQRLYSDCYQTVFHKNALDNVSQYREDVAVGARQVPCSVRMFMLANMVAHEVAQAAMIDHTDKARASRFSAKMLTGKLAVTRAKTYQSMCRTRYGTFNLSSLEVLTQDDKDPVEERIVRSEVLAGRWLVSFKIHNRAPRAESIQAMYEDIELDLDVEWLAIEPTYKELILAPYVKEKIGTEIQQRHRFDVWQAHHVYKKNPSLGRNVWLTRQLIIRQSVAQVLTHFSYSPKDFLYPCEQVTDIMGFWLELAAVIRHNQCWRFLNGEPSLFSAKRELRIHRS